MFNDVSIELYLIVGLCSCFLDTWAFTCFDSSSFLVDSGASCASQGRRCFWGWCESVAHHLCRQWWSWRGQVGDLSWPRAETRWLSWRPRCRSGDITASVFAMGPPKDPIRKVKLRARTVVILPSPVALPSDFPSCTQFPISLALLSQYTFGLMAQVYSFICSFVYSFIKHSLSAHQMPNTWVKQMNSVLIRSSGSPQSFPSLFVSPRVQRASNELLALEK